MTIDNEKAARVWEQYRKQAGLPEETYCEAWAFGSAPDELAGLVFDGIKTATASAFELYEIDGERLPQAGDYSVILDGADEPVCVICTVLVEVVPFDEVSAEHAFAEGEDDRSLEAWRRIHVKFFTEELEEYDMEFSEKMPVVCERFEVVWRV